MAHVEISHDEYKEASATLGSNVGSTGRHRYWKPLDGPAVLQCEWIQGVTGMTIWVDVPTVTELKD